MEIRSKTVSLFFFSFKKTSVNSKYAFTGKKRSSHFKPSKKRLSSVLTYMYSSTIYSKSQAFETFSLHFLEKGNFCWNTR